MFYLITLFALFGSITMPSHAGPVRYHLASVHMPTYRPVGPVRAQSRRY